MLPFYLDEIPTMKMSEPPKSAEERAADFLLNPRSSDIYAYSVRATVKIMAKKVENIGELKQMVQEIKELLNDLLKHGHGLEAFDAKVQQLFGSPVFLQALDEACLEEPDLIGVLDYRMKSKGAQERMDDLKDDPQLKHALGQMAPVAANIGILSILFGHWSDKDFYRELNRTRYESHKIREAAKPVVKKHKVDAFSKIDVSADLEGLKKALADKYGEKSRLYKSAVDQIERNKPYFERRLDTGSTLSYSKNKRIRGMLVSWSDGVFKLVSTTIVG